MKLERLNNSECNFDSLGEITFYRQFRNQFPYDVYAELTDYFSFGIQVRNYRTLLLAYLLTS
jgi:hypothetical protein